jgi:hypothetical protein
MNKKKQKRVKNRLFDNKNGADPKVFFTSQELNI